eukprot:3884862-Pleurochrysis_carterae.AAC.2
MWERGWTAQCGWAGGKGGEKERVQARSCGVGWVGRRDRFFPAMRIHINVIHINVSREGRGERELMRRGRGEEDREGRRWS